MADRAHSTPEINPLPLAFDLIDLDAHPDGALLAACAQATKLRDKLGADGGIGKRNVRSSEQDAYFRALDLITNTEAMTHLGLQMKAIYVLGDEMDPFEHAGAFVYASVIKDFLRMGVPA